MDALMNLKELIKEFDTSFVPNGRMLTKEELKIIKYRRTKNDEIYRCGAIVGDDWPQSGPIYCGRVADWISEIEDGKLCLCERHKPPKHQRTEK